MMRLLKLESIPKATLYIAVFLIPLFFLPITQNPLQYQKQTLLVVLMFLGVISWLGQVVSRGEFAFRKSWVHAGVGIFLLATLLSTVFSLWRYGSFWGLPLDVTDSFMTFLAFGLLYFLIVLSVESVSQLSHMLFVLVVSLAVGDTFAFLQLKGWFLFPFAQNTLFNTIGNPNSVALLSAVALPMALVFSVVFRGWKLWVSRLAAFVLFLFLSFTTFSSALIALSVGLLILLVFGMMSWRKRVSLGWVALPMALLAVTLFLLVFRTPLPGAPSIPPEVSPSFAGEMGIVKEVFRESPILGTGPGTFVFDYAKYHDPQLNATVFWGTRFSSGASEVLDMLMTRGAVGLLALLGLVLSALFFAFRGLVSRSQEGSGWMVGLAVFASFGVSVTGLLVYPSNFVLWFVFWVLLGSLVAVTGTRVQRFAIPASSPLTMVSSLAFLLTLIFGLGVIFVGAQKYTAEVRYLQGVQASNAGDLDVAIEKIVESANLSPSNDQYWRDLSQLYLSKLSQLSADTELSPDERDKLIQAVVGSALTSANRATLVSPNNVANWNVRGFVYRALPGGESLAAESYKRASELEPASPFSFGELARAYMVQAQRVNVQEEGGIEARESAYQLALDQLAKALELKSDYSTAHFLIAAILEQQGKAEEAIGQLTKAVEQLPNDETTRFQLGLLYYNQERFSSAQEQFEQVKKLNPQHANARYLLGLIYDQKGEADKARAEFAAVAQLNPDSQELKLILENLDNGLPALEGVTPQAPPVPETPPEL